MAKKKPVKKKQPVAKKVVHVRISNEDWLLHLIKVSENAVTGQGSSIDEFFTQQAARLKKQLQELRKK